MNQGPLLSRDANLSELEQALLESVKDDTVLIAGEKVPLAALARKVFVSDESFFSNSVSDNATSSQQPPEVTNTSSPGTFTTPTLKESP